MLHLNAVREMMRRHLTYKEAMATAEFLAVGPAATCEGAARDQRPAGRNLRGLPVVFGLGTYGAMITARPQLVQVGVGSRGEGACECLQGLDPKANAPRAKDDRGALGRVRPLAQAVKCAFADRERGRGGGSVYEDRWWCQTRPGWSRTSAGVRRRWPHGRATL